MHAPNPEETFGSLAPYFGMRVGNSPRDQQAKLAPDALANKDGVQGEDFTDTDQGVQGLKTEPKAQDPVRALTPPVTTPIKVEEGTPAPIAGMADGKLSILHPPTPKFHVGKRIDEDPVVSLMKEKLDDSLAHGSTQSGLVKGDAAEKEIRAHPMAGDKSTSSVSNAMTGIKPTAKEDIGVEGGSDRSMMFQDLRKQFPALAQMSDEQFALMQTMMFTKEHNKRADDRANWRSAVQAKDQELNAEMARKASVSPTKPAVINESFKPSGAPVPAQHQFPKYQPTPGLQPGHANIRGVPQGNSGAGGSVAVPPAQPSAGNGHQQWGTVPDPYEGRINNVQPFTGW